MATERNNISTCFVSCRLFARSKGGPLEHKQNDKKVLFTAENRTMETHCSSMAINLLVDLVASIIVIVLVEVVMLKPWPEQKKY